jgi:C-terminal processing protease CtpA/Prc
MTSSPKLDNDQVHGLTLNQAVEKMRGPVNTNIKLTLRQHIQSRKAPSRSARVEGQFKIRQRVTLTSDLEGQSAYSDGATLFVRATCSGPKAIRGS